MTEWYDFPNVKSTKILSFLFGSRGPRPDLPSPFGRKFLFCLLASGARFVESPQCNAGHEPEWPTPEIQEKAANVARSLNPSGTKGGVENDPP